MPYNTSENMLEILYLYALYDLKSMFHSKPIVVLKGAPMQAMQYYSSMDTFMYTVYVQMKELNNIFHCLNKKKISFLASP